ncbi:hypothetical protein [Sedimentibacter sp.]|uniref:hypothetical protein n=1 Tax=Sedimentibacter sp. TaxID=1960295 RepID=UPI0028AEC7A5|nr:hypothetical protein [Sedimentibacter sp.]
MIKELSKKYFTSHPLKEFSAARFEYSLYTMQDIEKLVNGRFNLDLKDLHNEAVIESAVKPEELLQCMGRVFQEATDKDCVIRYWRMKQK